MRTLNHILCHRGDAQGDAVAYRFFQAGGEAPAELTFRTLRQTVQAVAARLQQHGLAQQRGLLICESQQAFVIGFYACLMSGAVAVPCAPVRRTVLKERLRLLALDARPAFVLTDGALPDDMGPGLGNVLVLDIRPWLAAADVDALAAQWREPALNDASLAFLQYTSGSTGDPKGVMVSHGNLLHNCAAIQNAMAITAESAVLTALPLFHDMGLIGGVLESMISGCVAHFMSPAEAVQYPERWLQRISDYGITNSGGPNFMYELAARDVDPAQLHGCDLSGWQVAFCGAEPIRAATVARFTAKFAAHGFKPGAFYPCYGLAESTLFVTGHRAGIAPVVVQRDGTSVVGCGHAGTGMRVEIVEADTCRPTAPGAEGEIWVAGGSVAQGYWNRHELTERVFRARLNADDPTAFLRTGDLGHLHEGQLFVTGRLKDLIILYGKKYAPQDIELHANASHAALRADGGAAFAVEVRDRERLVVVHELERTWVRRLAEHPQVVAAVRSAVSQGHGVHVDDVVLIRPGALPRTSSGKVRRAQCRDDYLHGRLQLCAEPAEAS